MATVTVYATGDEIGTYSSLAMSGNSNGVKLRLFDVEPLGSATDVFRIVITQVNAGDTSFGNGQWVSIYAEPDTDPPSPPLYSGLNPQHDQFQGRASSGDHQVFTGDNIVFDLNGLSAGTVQYGPGLHPLRSEQLDFASFSDTPPVFPCYLAGTLIETDTGPLPVEVLKPGDLVKTLDHGLQPLIWCGSSKVDGTGTEAPVRIPAGALGNYRDLWVSPQHRMMMKSWQAELLFGSEDHFVAAHTLVDSRGITRSPRPVAQYVHVLCARHEVIFAEGIPSETLHLGQVTQDILKPAILDELRSAYPDLRFDMPTAKPCLKPWESRALTEIYPISTGLRSAAA